MMDLVAQEANSDGSWGGAVLILAFFGVLALYSFLQEGMTKQYGKPFSHRQMFTGVIIPATVIIILVRIFG